MIRWLRSLFGCSHLWTYRERHKGKLVLVCEDCGKVTPIVLKDARKLRGLQERIALSKAELQQGQRTPAEVVPLRPRAVRKEGA